MTHYHDSDYNTDLPEKNSKARLRRSLENVIDSLSTSLGKRYFVSEVEKFSVMLSPELFQFVGAWTGCILLELTHYTLLGRGLQRAEFTVHLSYPSTI